MYKEELTLSLHDGRAETLVVHDPQQTGKLPNDGEREEGNEMG